MQSTLWLSTPTTIFPVTKPALNSFASVSSNSFRIKSTPLTYESSSSSSSSSIVNYSSTFSVFPAEACDTLGGDACLADMYPEVKLKPQEKAPNTHTELVEREYLEYNDAKTVFRAEACDDLGGTFCESTYQKGVY